MIATNTYNKFAWIIMFIEVELIKMKNFKESVG